MQSSVIFVCYLEKPGFCAGRRHAGAQAFVFRAEIEPVGK